MDENGRRRRKGRAPAGRVCRPGTLAAVPGHATIYMPARLFRCVQRTRLDRPGEEVWRVRPKMAPPYRLTAL